MFDNKFSYIEKEEYNKYDMYSIEEYGQKMVGKTFNDICLNDINNSFVSEPSFEYMSDHENKKRKGGLGQIVEERFFHYKVNNESAPDFVEAGVELKVTPYKINKNNTLSAKERLVLNMIDYDMVINEIDFEKSHFWYKNQLILLVYYLYKEYVDRLQYEIHFVRLFTPKKEDINIIKHDYQLIINKIKEGKAHELSESDTLYLSACTKSSDSSKRRSQPNSDILAKPRAFAYKVSYMTYVLNNVIITGKPLFESIVKKDEVDDLESYVINQIEKYKGKSFIELCDHFGLVDSIKAKNLGSMIAFRMLGVKGNNAEEFVKANIKVKTIRINANGRIKENMSFPTFRFTDIANQEWEESDFYDLLSTTKFLFVVYKEDENGDFRLDHARFWNMPINTLNSEVKNVWERTKYVINNLPVDLRENGRFKSIFPKQSENPVSHVRPHAKDSKDTYLLPDGREYPKQCFWLNNSYILSILNNDK